MAFPDTGISVVTAGLHDLNEFNGNEQVRHVTLSNTWIHEEFDGYIGPHDIGLMVFQTPFTFDGFFVNAIELPTPDEGHTGAALFHGWGSVSYTTYPSYPNILQSASLPIIPLQTCRISWEVPDLVQDNHICAGSLDGGVNACSMDSGGALVQNGEAVGIFVLAAIPCGLPMRPAIYTRVSAYVPWIQNIITNN